MSSLQTTVRESLGARWREGELLSRHATLRIGGPADHWVEPETRAELLELLHLSTTQGWPLTIVGLGSNTLFPDEGIRGLVLRLRGELAAVTPLEGGHVEIGAGAINAHIVRGLLKEGRVGMEFLSLIPGTFGGSVVMNAGTKETCIASILESVEMILPFGSQGWTTERVSAQDLQLSYRHAEIPPGAVLVSGVIQTEAGDVDAARANVKFDKDRRNQTQPYRLASVGSTFANPPGDYAGRLIEAVGLKGHRVGGAMVSDLHANFFINEDGATAHDFLSLMALARVRVRQSFGVELRPEVRFVGFDGWAALTELEQSLEES